MPEWVKDALFIAAMIGSWVLFWGHSLRYRYREELLQGSGEDARWAKLDRVTREALAMGGDDGTKPRTVDHLAHFPTSAEAREYSEFVKKLGYTLASTDGDGTAVEFNKVSAVCPGSFDTDLKVLRGKAGEMGGEYDGWGCVILGKR